MRTNPTFLRLAINSNWKFSTFQRYFPQNYNYFYWLLYKQTEILKYFKTQTAFIASTFFYLPSFFLWTKTIKYAFFRRQFFQKSCANYLLYKNFCFTFNSKKFYLVFFKKLTEKVFPTIFSRMQKMLLSKKLQTIPVFFIYLYIVTTFIKESRGNLNSYKRFKQSKFLNQKKDLKWKVALLRSKTYKNLYIFFFNKFFFRFNSMRSSQVLESNMLAYCMLNFFFYNRLKHKYSVLQHLKFFFFHFKKFLFKNFMHFNKLSSFYKRKKKNYQHGLLLTSRVQLVKKKLSEGSFFQKGFIVKRRNFIKIKPKRVVNTRTLFNVAGRKYTTSSKVLDNSFYKNKEVVKQKNCRSGNPKGDHHKKPFVRNHRYGNPKGDHHKKPFVRNHRYGNPKGDHHKKPFVRNHRYGNPKGGHHKFKTQKKTIGRFFYYNKFSRYSLNTYSQGYKKFLFFLIKMRLLFFDANSFFFFFSLGLLKKHINIIKFLKLGYLKTLPLVLYFKAPGFKKFIFHKSLRGQKLISKSLKKKSFKKKLTTISQLSWPNCFYLLKLLRFNRKLNFFFFFFFFLRVFFFNFIPFSQKQCLTFLYRFFIKDSLYHFFFNLLFHKSFNLLTFSKPFLKSQFMKSGMARRTRYNSSLPINGLAYNFQSESNNIEFDYPGSFFKLSPVWRDRFFFELVVVLGLKNSYLILKTLIKYFELTKNHSAFWSVMDHAFQKYGAFIPGIHLQISGKFRPRYGGKKIKKKTRKYLYGKTVSLQQYSQPVCSSSMTGFSYLGSFGFKLYLYLI